MDALTDENIAETVRRDPDALEAQPEWFERAMLLRPGRPKERVTVRLGADVLDWFRRRGRGYQTRLNAVLRLYYEAHRRKL